jgi:hypothetical protein
LVNSYLVSPEAIVLGLVQSTSLSLMDAAIESFDNREADEELEVVEDPAAALSFRVLELTKPMASGLSAHSSLETPAGHCRDRRERRR